MAGAVALMALVVAVSLETIALWNATHVRQP